MVKKYTLEEIKEAMQKANEAIMQDKDINKDPLGLATLVIGNMLFIVKFTEALRGKEK